MTEREKQIFYFIVKFAVENGYLPTMRDIMDGIGIYSTATVKFHFDRLNEKGFIFRKDGKSGYTVKGLRYVYEGVFIREAENEV